MLSNPGKFQSLRFFDASIPEEMAEAEVYRRAELPFVMRNVDDLPLEKWGSDDRLSDLAQKDSPAVDEAVSHASIKTKRIRVCVSLVLQIHTGQRALHVFSRSSARHARV